MNAQSAIQPDEAWPASPFKFELAPPIEAAGEEPPRQPQIDYEACLDYVRQVGSAIRSASVRVRAREAAAEELVRHSKEQLARAETALRQSEEKVREAAFKIHDAEGRANRAEARAAEAEAWLNRLFDTMQQELHAVQTGGAAGGGPLPSTRTSQPE